MTTSAINATSYTRVPVQAAPAQASVSLLDKLAELVGGQFRGL